MKINPDTSKLSLGVTFFIRFCLCVLGFGLGAAPTLVAAASDWNIEYAEPVRISTPLQIDSVLSSEIKKLTFSALGKSFPLHIKSNKSFINASTGLNIPPGVQLYAGSVENVPESWVRLTYANGTYSGAIYDGSELFFIDASPIATRALERAPGKGTSGPVMYRASDIQSSMTCALNGHSQEKFTYQALVDDLKASIPGLKTSRKALANGSLYQISVNIVADREYSAKVSGDSRTEILSQMNVVDGIFSEQVGVRIAINEIDVLSHNGSLTSNKSESLLGAFRDYAGRTHPGIAHLFTGKSLDGGGTLGIAYLDAICSDYGVGVSQAGGRGIGGALIVAHEFGHNFGAPHDNQGGSACAHESDQYLMNPYYNRSDQFSQCSISQMDRIISGAGCLTLVDGGGGPGGETDVLTPSKSSYTLGETVVIDYSDGSGSSRDWIGIFRKGDLTGSCQQNDQYVDWSYTNGARGTASFTGLEAGEYEAQLFSDDGYCYIGKAVQFTITSVDDGPSDTLTTTKATFSVGEAVVINYHDGSGSTRDWIGIFRQNDLTRSCEQNDRYLAWSYTNGKSGKVTFEGLTPGDYAAQLFSNDSYCHIGRSLAFSVNNEDDGGTDVPDSDLPYTGLKDSSGLCLTVDAARLIPQAKVMACSFGLSDAAQRWRLTEAGVLQSQSTGLCLTPGSVAVPADLFLEPCAMNPWFIWTHQDGVLINAHSPNVALTSAQVEGAWVSMKSQSGADDQQWQFGGALSSSLVGLLALLVRTRRQNLKATKASH